MDVGNAGTSAVAVVADDAADPDRQAPATAVRLVIPAELTGLA